MWIELVSGLALNHIIGALWYSPLLFQSTFLRTTPTPKSMKHEMKAWMIPASGVLGALEVFGLFHALFNVIGVKNGEWKMGVWWAYLIWQFFIFPSMAVHYIFDTSRPIQHLAMVSGHHLASMVLEGALMVYLH